MPACSPPGRGLAAPRNLPAPPVPPRTRLESRPNCSALGLSNGGNQCTKFCWRGVHRNMQRVRQVAAKQEAESGELGQNGEVGGGAPGQTQSAPQVSHLPPRAQLMNLPVKEIVNKNRKSRSFRLTRLSSCFQLRHPEGSPRITNEQCSKNHISTVFAKLPIGWSSSCGSQLSVDS